MSREPDLIAQDDRPPAQLPGEEWSAVNLRRKGVQRIQARRLTRLHRVSLPDTQEQVEPRTLAGLGELESTRFVRRVPIRGPRVRAVAARCVAANECQMPLQFLQAQALVHL